MPGQDGPGAGKAIAPARDGFQRVPIGSQRLANGGNVDVEGILPDGNARPQTIHDLVFGDHLTGRPDQEFEDAERPPAEVLRSYRALLRAARLAMLLSYALMYVLAPLMPEIMTGVGLETASAARAASLLDVARLSCFVALFAFHGWHGRKLPILIAIAALPVGFALVLLGPHIATVISGEVLFGAAAGFLYTAALYYAQVVENASVDAGGAHEALIGVGYALGPGAGLIGTALAHGAGPGSAAYTQGMSIATLPLIAVCSCAALWQLLRHKRTSASNA